MSTGLMQIVAVTTGFGGNGTHYTLPGGQSAPTKSAVVGMLAAACGRKKTDSIADLNALKIATATVNPGVVHTRFNTTTGGRQLDGEMRDNPLIRKKAYFQAANKGPIEDYLIRHIVAFEHPNAEFVDYLLKQLAAPVFPVFIGRSNGKPVEPVPLGSIDGTLFDAMKLIKVPTTAMIEVIPSMKIAHKRRVMDVIESFDNRRVLSRMVVQQRT